ncbi:MAG: acetyltransferase [Anaerocolumna sp.]|nr:acetyltransferase [Anaerocolumna sp.]
MNNIEHVTKLMIEKGTVADIDEMEQFYNDILNSLEQGVNYPGWKKGIYPTKEGAVHGIKCDDLLIARYNNEIVGSIILNHIIVKGYETAPWNIYATDDEIYVVHTLAVHPKYAKNGVGSQLLEFAEEYGRKNNIKALRLDVYEHNTPAIRLYEKCGYKYIDKVDLGYGAYGLDWYLLFEKILEE